MRRLKKLVGVYILATTALGAMADPSLHFGAPYIITGGLGSSFSRPYGLGVDGANGRLLVADTGNNRFKWVPVANLTGAYTFTDVGYLADRTDPNALTDPQAIAADATGDVYVVNTLKGNVKLYTFSAGSYTISATFCSTTPHTVAGVDIQLPRDIAVGPDGAVYLLDSGNKRILKADGPAATAWTVFKSDSSWSDPYGLTVDSSGNIFVADTGNHRIIKIAGGTTTTFGHWGTGNGEFRFPRDVAVDQFGRIFVADTFNHRIQVLGADGHYLIALGHAPSMGTLDKVEVDSSQRVFAVDSDNNDVVAYLGAGAPVPFDPFVRDYLGDTGAEPSDTHFSLSSPDILVRHHPDVDIAAATSAGLESISFQQPLYGKLNYVYLAVHNKGTQPASDNFIRVYSVDPGNPGVFPADWSDAGFYEAYTDSTHNTPGNTLSIPSIPAGGVTVVGPILWQPPAPESAIAHDGVFHLGVRVTNPFDYPPVGSSTTMVRDSNDVGQRNVTVIRGPFPAGDQNTLLVRVHYSDIAAVIDPNTINARTNELAAWIKEVSYGEANVNILQRGPVVPPHDHTYYNDPSNSRLVELAQDVLSNLLLTEPALLDGSGPGHEINRIILVSNDLNDTRDWATTGLWQYMIGGKTYYLTVSVQGGNNSTPLFAHGLSHQLNLVDLYAHENVSFPRPYADGWDNMAEPMNGAHPLVWSKELATWVSSHNAKIIYVPRPPGGGTWNNGGNPVHIYYQETAASNQPVAVAFGLTEGVTSFADETAFYYVEARKNTGGQGAAADMVLPQTGVIMYYVNSQIPQGQGPVILRDHVPGGTLADAAIPVGGNESPGGTGISVTVQTGTAGADYDLNVQYNPPITDYDVMMHPGNPNWESPDIWVDNQKDGYDEDNNRPPKDRGNEGIAGEENRLYAQVFNNGPATAFDIEVAFQISEPYHTVGNVAAFNDFKSVFIDQLAGGQNTTRYVPWTPKTGVDPHTCARVELRRMFDDTNPANNMAQRNLHIDHSEHGSPYTPVEMTFQVNNSETTAKPVYFRADGVPKGWTWSINPPKVFLAPKAVGTAMIKLQPPIDAPDCTSHRILVSGWVPRGDTLVRLGGTTLQVDMQKKTAIKMVVRLDECRGQDIRALTENEGKTPATTTATAAGRPATKGETPCRRLVVMGEMIPRLPNQDIIVRYIGPDGNPIYHTVLTDTNGLFTDFNPVGIGSNWEASAEFPGDQCQGPAIATNQIIVPLPEPPQVDGPLPDPSHRFCIAGLTMNLDGQLLSVVPEIAKSECKTMGFEEKIILRAVPNKALGEDSIALDGEITINDLRQIVDDSLKRTGLARGRFIWKGKGAEAAGFVTGVSGIGTHHAPGTPECKEPAIIQGHLELLFDGTIVAGHSKGERVRAVAALDLPGPVGTPTDKKFIGTLEGEVEADCDLKASTLERRLILAREQMAAPPEGPCDGLLPCLRRISKAGQGNDVLDETEQTGCDKDGCVTEKYWSRLRVKLQGNAAIEGSVPVIGDGVFSLTNYIEIFNQDGGRGVHFGAFTWQDGKDARIVGEMLGISQSGTHRDPLHEACEPFDAKGQMEGRIHGTIVSGQNRGAQVEAHYVIQFQDTNHRRRAVGMNIDGWTITGCIGAPQNQSQPVRPGETGQPPVRTNSPVLVFKPAILSDEIYRPLEKIDPQAIARFKAVEGGTLTENGQREIRIADKRFRDADADHKGYLGAAEFATLYAPNAAETDKRSVAATSKALADSYLALYDKNKNGAITREEAGLAWDSLQALDVNHDGKITVAELEKAPALSAARDFKKIDGNGDGRIDFTEFVLWWRTLPHVGIITR